MTKTTKSNSWFNVMACDIVMGGVGNEMAAIIDLV